MRVVQAGEFEVRIREALTSAEVISCDFVTGPGRSGAIAAVYASHILGIPFIPAGSMPPNGRVLVIDTATESGKTLRKMKRRYSDFSPVVLAVYNEPPRVAFWYESTKPQRYKHERIAA